jgi:molybdate transport system substrate-binding protein
MSKGTVRAGIYGCLLAACLAGCGRDGASRSANQGAVLVLVAASTNDAVKEVATAFTAETGIAVRINPDDSSKLATQIVNGAPADVFLSANEKWAVYVKDKGFAQESVPLLGNDLVLVVPTDNPGRVSKPADLTTAAVKRVAVAGPTVPAGIYAREALGKLGLWDQLENDRKTVTGENVRVTLTYVERGEAEAGVVYATDAKITGAVQTVYTFPASTHEPIVYPLVLLQAGAKNEAARKFYDFLQSPAAAHVFIKCGFRRLALRAGSVSDDGTRAP